MTDTMKDKIAAALGLAIVAALALPLIDNLTSDRTARAKTSARIQYESTIAGFQYDATVTMVDADAADRDVCQN